MIVETELEEVKKRLIEPHVLDGTPYLEDIAEFVDSANETELEEPCYDCNGEVQVLKRDCPKCQKELHDKRTGYPPSRNY